MAHNFCHPGKREKRVREEKAREDRYMEVKKIGITMNIK